MKLFRTCKAYGDTSLIEDDSTVVDWISERHGLSRVSVLAELVRGKPLETRYAWFTLVDEHVETSEEGCLVSYTNDHVDMVTHAMPLQQLMGEAVRLGWQVVSEQEAQGLRKEMV